MILARSLNCSVSEMEERISEDEYLDHLADYQMSPWGPERLEVAIARGFTALLNAWGSEAKIKDMIPVWDEYQTEEELELKEKFEAAVFNAQGAALGGKNGVTR